jgi:hypothetical protein
MQPTAISETQLQAWIDSRDDSHLLRKEGKIEGKALTLYYVPEDSSHEGWYAYTDLVQLYRTWCEPPPAGVESMQHSDFWYNMVPHGWLGKKRKLVGACEIDLHETLPPYIPYSTLFVQPGSQ